MKILITAPSLNTASNVSGISSVVINIINHSSHSFRHFHVGRKDNEKGGFRWILKQVRLILKFPAYLRDIDIAHINTALNPLSIFRDITFVLICRFMHKKVLLHLHGGKYLMNKCKNPVIRFFINRMIGYSSFVLVLSPLEEEILKSKYPKKRIAFLVNSIPVERIFFSRNTQKFNKPLVISFLGRIHESKGIHDIVSAFEILNKYTTDYVFNLYGNGPLKNFVIGKLEFTLGHRFQYKGVVSGETKWKAFEESDVFLLPSRYGEGLPMAMLEAMALGNVVMVTDDASITYAVTDGVNGLLIKKYNPENIAEKLKMLIENRSMLSSLSEKAIETIHVKFNLQNYIEKLEVIYASI